MRGKNLFLFLLGCVLLQATTAIVNASFDDSVQKKDLPLWAISCHPRTPRLSILGTSSEPSSHNCFTSTILSLIASQTCVLPTTYSCSLRRWSSSKKMMCDFKQSTERVGLKIHPDKTKILSNQSSNRKKEVAINSIRVEISPACESAKYLGQTITFQQQGTAEIKNRIRVAWASFHRYKQELTSK